MSFIIATVRVPPLNELYLETNDVDRLNERWNLFGWIMSFDDEVIAAIQRLPKKYLLTSTTLYALVKVMNAKEDPHPSTNMTFTQLLVFPNFHIHSIN